ncbi:NAD(P)H-binding protein [Longispora albida]|uniref:NAD(P)H-binding protein n=1 Tax=Longispora albida TaxID=203523 RepID=UPI0003619D4F|nr:NAD(P)H-binding protein [Longispora albida]
MTITLVTGARGKVATALAARLREAGLPVRAASKDPSALDLPSDVERAELDLTNPDTFAAALTGVSQVFLYPEPDGIHDFVKAAEAAKVGHVVVLSSSTVLAPGAENDPLARPNVLVERALEGAAFTTTLLRPDAFASNALGWAYQISNGMPIDLAFPEAGIAPVHPEDLADIAAAALTGHPVAGRAVMITGPESLTFREQIGVIGGLLGREIPVRAISRADAEAQLSQWVPAHVATALHDLWEPADGRAAVIGETTLSLLGRPARTFSAWAAGHIQHFGGN